MINILDYFKNRTDLIIEKHVQRRYYLNVLKKTDEQLKRISLLASENLTQAMMDIEEWGGYADDYFQEKHNLKDDICRVELQAAFFHKLSDGDFEITEIK
ncbi:MAG: hypothetical protein ACJA0H_002340 [Francisellaceae bacterium]|jgi:hypothetical protein